MSANIEKVRICVDLDGTICNLREAGQTYEEVKPKDGVVAFLNQLKDEGFDIIINTARGMGTAGGNEGAAMKRVGLDTLLWLERHHIPYDEIYFGKPNAHLTIDDRSLRFSSWTDLTINEIRQLLKPE